MWGEISNIWWLLILIPVSLLAIYVYRWRESVKKGFSEESLFVYIFPTEKSNRYWVKMFFFIAALLLLIISLMDPLWGVEEQKIKREGIDVVYALDLSSSMDAEDVAPSRLEKAKKLISESVNRLGGDRVGLIIFAGDAYMISPLTNDYAAIQSYLNSAETNLLSKQGTNYANVILKAIEIFEGVINTDKVLILISDGEEHNSSSRRAMEMAEEENIRIVTMGVGTTKGSPIPIKEYGKIVDYKMDRYGETVITKLEDSTLKNMAQQTQGIYIPVTQIDNSLDQLHNYFSNIERNEEETATIQDKKHAFQWFLGLALLLIFIDTLTTEHIFFNTKK